MFIMYITTAKSFGHFYGPSLGKTLLMSVYRKILLANSQTDMNNTFFLKCCSNYVKKQSERQIIGNMMQILTVYVKCRDVS